MEWKIAFIKPKCWDVHSFGLLFETPELVAYPKIYKVRSITLIYNDYKVREKEIT